MTADRVPANEITEAEARAVAQWTNALQLASTHPIYAHAIRCRALVAKIDAPPAPPFGITSEQRELVHRQITTQWRGDVAASIYQKLGLPHDRIAQSIDALTERRDQKLAQLAAIPSAIEAW